MLRRAHFSGGISLQFNSVDVSCCSQSACRARSQCFVPVLAEFVVQRLGIESTNKRQASTGLVTILYTEPKALQSPQRGPNASLGTVEPRLQGATQRKTWSSFLAGPGARRTPQSNLRHPGIERRTASAGGAVSVGSCFFSSSQSASFSVTVT